MLKQILESIEKNEEFTSPLSDRSSPNTFKAKKTKVDKSLAVMVGDKDSEVEMFTSDNTIYQRMGKKYYSQTFATDTEADSYLRKIA